MKYRYNLFASSMMAVMSMGLANSAIADEGPVALGEMIIIGDSEAARRLPGSASVIGNDQLTVEAATDINQMLKTVPGVYIQEEEGNALVRIFAARWAEGAVLLHAAGLASALEGDAVAARLVAKEAEESGAPPKKKTKKQKVRDVFFVLRL